jgi:hypothetical protein
MLLAFDNQGAMGGIVALQVHPRHRTEAPPTRVGRIQERQVHVPESIEIG